MAEIHLDKSSFTEELIHSKIKFPLFANALDNFNIQLAISHIWMHISNLDSKIQEEEPFKVIKQNREKGKQIIVESVKEVFFIAKCLEPFMPTTSEKIKKAILENKMPEALFPRKE